MSVMVQMLSTLISHLFQLSRYPFLLLLSLPCVFSLTLYSAVLT